MKYAVLSMDIEDWYHLDYFDRDKCDTSQSLLDGIEVYRDILAHHGILSSFFVLGELVKPLKKLLEELVADGHDLAGHGWNHERPLTKKIDDFAADLKKMKETFEDLLCIPCKGYRAPCFSIDRDRLNYVYDIGYLYDSSRILFKHPLYGTLDMQGFDKLSRNIFKRNDFFEFQVSTLYFAGRNIPVSGGGYIRIFPWFFMSRLIESYLKKNNLYVLYIHPFELSTKTNPLLPRSTKMSQRIRFQQGRFSVISKLESLISLLQKNNFKFTTFSSLRQKLLVQPEGDIPDD